jgi:hypothetical protein
LTAACSVPTAGPSNRSARQLIEAGSPVTDAESLDDGDCRVGPAEGLSLRSPDRARLDLPGLLVDDLEPATTHFVGLDPHEVVLRRGVPREQRQRERVGFESCRPLHTKALVRHPFRGAGQGSTFGRSTESLNGLPNRETSSVPLSGTDPLMSDSPSS